MKIDGFLNAGRLVKIPYIVGGKHRVQNFGNIMKQAKQMQEQIGRLQQELEAKTIEAQAGGGMVRVVVNGKFNIVSIKIEKDVVNPEDIEMLQDLIAAAVNEGIRKAQEMASAEMAKITGGLGIPGMGM